MFWKRAATLQIGSRRYDMSNLYFEFEVPFKDSDTLGTASITVHNLSESTRNEIVKGTPVILNAGYEGDVGVIFTGKVSRVVNEHSDTEWITKITGVEALEEWLSSEVNKTYAEGSTSSSIINDLLTMFGLEIGTMELVEDKTYSRGRVCKGKVKDVLKEIVTLDCKSRFLIRNGTVIISDPATGQDMGYELSASTGLLRADTETSDTETTTNQTTQSKEEKTPTYTRRCLLNYHLNPADVITIKSQTLNGKYLLVAGSHKGKPDGDWVTEIEVKPA